MKISLFNLIKAGNIEEAFDRGANFLNEMQEYQYLWTTLQSRLHDKKREYSKGTLTEESFTQHKNSINSELIELIEKIDTKLKSVVLTDHATEQSFKDKLQNVLIATYEIKDRISVGNSTVTYQAVEKSDGHLVAIRALQNDNLFTHSNAFDEIKKVQKINHRNIIPVLRKSGKNEVPSYVIMEYVKGINLETIVKESGPRPVSETKRLLISMADALYYLHKRKIFSADLRASSIIVDNEGEPMISPFTVYRNQPESNYQQIVANLKYMSYQRLNAIGYKDDTPQSNQFSLGVLAYLLIVGESLFQSQRMIDLIEERIAFHKNEAFIEKKLSSLVGPEELTYLVRVLLTDHYPNMYEVLSALKDIDDDSNESNRIAQESYIRACSSNPEMTLQIVKKLEEIINTESHTDLERLAMKLHNTIILLIETNPEKNYLQKVNQSELSNLFTEKDTIKRFKKVLFEYLEKEDYLWEKKTKQCWEETLNETFEELRNLKKSSD